MRLRSVGHAGCRGRALGGCTRLTTGCLGKEPQLGKRGIKMVLGGTYVVKYRDKEIKRAISV